MPETRPPRGTKEKTFARGGNRDDRQQRRTAACIWRFVEMSTRQTVTIRLRRKQLEELIVQARGFRDGGFRDRTRGEKVALATAMNLLEKALESFRRRSG